MSFGIGSTPKWFSEFSWKDFFGGLKEDVVKVPKIVGTVIGDTISGISKPILTGARSALTPTIIWAVVIIIIGLILFKNYKKVLG